MNDVFETYDLDEARDMLERTYCRMRLSVSGDVHHVRIAQVDLGPVALHHFTLRMRIAAEMAPMGVIAVGRIEPGWAPFLGLEADAVPA